MSLSLNLGLTLGASVAAAAPPATTHYTVKTPGQSGTFSFHVGSTNRRVSLLSASDSGGNGGGSARRAYNSTELVYEYQCDSANDAGTTYFRLASDASLACQANDAAGSPGNFDSGDSGFTGGSPGGVFANGCGGGGGGSAGWTGNGQNGTDGGLDFTGLGGAAGAGGSINSVQYAGAGGSGGEFSVNGSDGNQYGGGPGLGGDRAGGNGNAQGGVIVIEEDY